VIRNARALAVVGLLTVMSASAGFGRVIDTLSITPASGVSYVHRAGTTFEHSSMGRIGWFEGPSVAGNVADVTTLSDLTVGPRTLSGADLYRLQCRACHGAAGEGSPPEVNSLLDPVRGTSIALWQRRMKDIGRTIDPAMANEIVSGARTDLRNRVVHGGKKMPPFDFLRASEVDALIAYLDLLGGVPEAPPQHAVVVPATRVGEFLVKGTCHTCHDATGVWPTPEAMLNGAIPPLSGLPTHHTLLGVVEKVRRGKPVVLGATRITSAGRMPEFYYVTNDEAAAAYLYLVTYPPR
jgi:mono/diheme cytochrome c family protein